MSLEAAASVVELTVFPVDISWAFIALVAFICFLLFALAMWGNFSILIEWRRFRIRLKRDRR